MQVDEEAMYSMWNHLHVSGKKPCNEEQYTCKWMKKPCILCGTIYMQVDEEAMYSMRNNLHASG